MSSGWLFGIIPRFIGDLGIVIMIMNQLGIIIHYNYHNPRPGNPDFNQLVDRLGRRVQR